MDEKFRKKLRHASSRKIFLRNNIVVKCYPIFYGYVFHDVIRMLFFMIYGIHDISFISPRRRIFNEIRGRKVLKAMRVKTTEIKMLSLKRKYFEEKFEKIAFPISDVEKTSPMKAAKCAKAIGKITCRLHHKGYYFIDNRASNWMINKDIIRTDLEFFNSKIRYRKFFMFCDIISFISSLQNKKIKEKFMEGYGKNIRQFKLPILLQFLIKFYIKITDIIF